MKKLIEFIMQSRGAIFLLLVLSLSSVKAQNPAQFWFFGWGLNGTNISGIDFTGGSPVQYNGVAKMNEGSGFYESITIQTDATKVLWYSNSHYIYDQSYALMPGVISRAGGKLVGAQGTAEATATQGVISFYFPGTLNKYVMISTAGEDGPNHGLLYTDIDMSLQGNGPNPTTPYGDLGVNVETNITPGINTLECQGIFMPDCDNVWVVSHEQDTDNFIAVKFTSSGPGSVVVSKVGPVITGAGARSSLKISPDGTKLVMTGGFSAGIRLYDFDSATGIVSSEYTLGASTFSFGYGLEWSPNSKYVYLSGYTGIGGIVRYDVINHTSANIGGTVDYGDLQMGPDGKIYCTQKVLGGTHLATITNADAGPAATFNASGYTIGGEGGWLGLPAVYSANCLTVGINKKVNNESVIHPNPVSNILYVKVVKSSFGIDVLDVSGKVVLSTISNEIDVSNLSDGIYFLRYFINGIFRQQKFLKN